MFSKRDELEPKLGQNWLPGREAKLVEIKAIGHGSESGKKQALRVILKPLLPVSKSALKCWIDAAFRFLDGPV